MIAPAPHDLAPVIWDTSALQAYLDDLPRDDMLSHNEVCELARRGRAGDTSAYARIVECNLRLVVAVARGYQRRTAGCDIMDLIQEGNLGLMHAARKFDPDKGYRFSTYAHWWITQHIARAANTQSGVVALPAHIGEHMGKVNRATLELTGELNREPTVPEIAARTGETESEVRNVIQARSMLSMTSLDAPLPRSKQARRYDADMRLADVIVDETAGIDAVAERGDLRERIEAALQRLTPRERAILARRYGLDLHGGGTLQEVGREHGVSRERIRQIEEVALRKLAPLLRQEVGA